MCKLSVCALLAFVASDAAAVNLAQNASFDSTILFWDDPNNVVELVWSPLDADGSPTSGSIQITTTNTSGGATGALQCVEPGSVDVEVLRADLRLPEQGAVDPVYGQIFVTYYSVPGCGTGYIETSDFPGIPEGTDWTTLEAALTPPGGTQSIRIWLTLAYQTNPSPLVVYADNVYLPEPAGAEWAALLGIGLVGAAQRRTNRRMARTIARSTRATDTSTSAAAAATPCHSFSQPR
jgi:hypothetical protein